MTRPLRIVRFSGAALTDGIENHQIDSVSVRVTNVSRTVVGCFKFRNKIGLDVAIETHGGVTFKADAVRAAEVRKEANYAGVRVTLLGVIDGARCKIQTVPDWV